MPARYAVRLLSLVCISIISLGSFAQSDPWTDAQTVQPADLNKELAIPKTAPMVLFVGFGRLFTAGHIKGAQFHGSGGNAEGLAQVKAWAATQPKSTNLVI